MRKTNQFIIRISVISLLLLIIGTSVSALAAANTVPVSYADDITIPIDQSQFYPYQCAGMIFVDVIVGSGSIKGGSGNDLIYGSPGDDNIRGGNGDDCIVGGGGNDILRGQNGDDVLIGGSGSDTIEAGPGFDVCYFGDVVSDCETVY